MKSNLLSVCAAFLLCLGFLGSAGQASARGFAGSNLPLNDLGTGLYLGIFQGGLYPKGLNTIPAEHAAEGLARMAAVTPLGTDGSPDSSGKIVLLSIGVSNARTEYCGTGWLTDLCATYSFMGQAVLEPAIERENLYLVNGAVGGAGAVTWIDPLGSNYDSIRDWALLPKGLSEAQVQAVWMKMANVGPSVSLPSTDADAYDLLSYSGEILRELRVRYPNLQMVFVSSRIYGGYAVSGTNPEPFAYESGFAMKWLVEAQINQMQGAGIDPVAGDLDYHTAAPWVAWGPYLWADGAVPRLDGLTWEVEDFLGDGTHPSPTGAQKVGERLLDFFGNSPFTAPWLTGTVQASGNVTGQVGLEAREDATGTVVTALLWNTPVANAFTGPDGDFNLMLPPATYGLAARAPGYLEAHHPGISVQENGTLPMPFVELSAGDLDMDGLVADPDIIMLQNAYGLACDGPVWDPVRDINADCVVNILDLGIAAANYGLAGPVDWPSPEAILNRQSPELKESLSPIR